MVECESGGMLGPAQVELQPCKNPTMKIIRSTRILIRGVWLLRSSVAVAPFLCTAFTYQGKLTADTQPADGSYDLKFTLFDTGRGGNRGAKCMTNSRVSVTKGLFTVVPDSGVSVFTGDARRVNNGARTTGGAAFSMLSLRRLLTTTTYCLIGSNARAACTLFGDTIIYGNTALSHASGPTRTTDPRTR